MDPTGAFETVRAHLGPDQAPGLVVITLTQHVFESSASASLQRQIERAAHAALA